jgi:fructosamine-3-kinase
VTGHGPAEAAATLLGGTLQRAVPLAGGDLSQVLRVTLADGRQAIVKGGPAPRVEAAMLRAIAASGAPAPAVLAVSDQVLVLQALQGGGGVGGAWASLGAALACLHATTGERYGWPDHYAFAELRIDNTWLEDWPAFWAERRLLCHVPFLPPALARRVEALARDCPNRLPARPPPALLHGDLWGGNVLAANGVVTGLIDPACYYGHGEVDIAMLEVFDHPGRALFEAYGALEPGWEARLVIYKLWPALVHFRLFGSGYRGMVEGLLASARE